jgi:hypothetical protein
VAVPSNERIRLDDGQHRPPVDDRASPTRVRRVALVARRGCT